MGVRGDQRRPRPLRPRRQQPDGMADLRIPAPSQRHRPLSTRPAVRARRFHILSDFRTTSLYAKDAPDRRISRDNLDQRPSHCAAAVQSMGELIADSARSQSCSEHASRGKQIVLFCTSRPSGPASLSGDHPIQCPADRPRVRHVVVVNRESLARWVRMPPCKSR